MYKVGENRKCTELPQTELKHLTVKITQLYTKYLLLGLNFWSVSLYDQGFPRYRMLCNSPLTTMLKRPKKKSKKKLPKIQSLKCHYSLNNFDRDPPQE